MAGGGGASKGGGLVGKAIRSSDMEKMSVDQLKSLKEQSDLEVNLLQDSVNNIRTAASRLEIASNALHDLSLRPQGKKMLVPLTASLYVPGTLDDADRVLVDVGTGYFIEKTMAEGEDYCHRKINLLKSNYDELVEVAEGARLRGASRIIGVDKIPEKFEIGKNLGLTDYINPADCGDKPVSEVCIRGFRRLA